jgi:hypothetical protein
LKRDSQAHTASSTATAAAAAAVAESSAKDDVGLVCTWNQSLSRLGNHRQLPRLLLLLCLLLQLQLLQLLCYSVWIPGD